MPALDISTLLFLLAVSNVILACLMASHAPTSQARPIVILWAAARFLQGSAQFWLWLRPLLSDPLDILIPDGLLIVGLAFEAQAIASDWKRYRLSKPVGLMALIACFGVAAASILSAEAGWRIACIAGFGLAAYLPIFAIYLEQWRKGSLLHRFIALSYGLMLVAVVARLGLAVFIPAESLMTGGLTQLLTFLPLTTFTILNGFGFVIAMHQKTERHLENSEAILEHAQEIARITSWSADLRSHTLVTHRGRTDSRPRPLEKIFASIHPDDQILVRHAWNQAISGGAPYDILHRVVRRGRRRWLHSRAEIVRNAAGEAIRVTGISHDVTDLREVQEALETYQRHLEGMVSARSADLREAEAQTRLILESAAEGMIGIDTAGTIIFANRAAYTLLGFDQSSLIGRNVHEITHHGNPEGELCSLESCVLTESLRNGLPCHRDDECFRRADGRNFPVSFSSQAMLRDGLIVGAVFSFSDTSEQRKMREAREEALVAAQNLARARSEFIANMSHEIRTPLNAVLGLAQLGMRHSTSTHDHETFTRIVDSGNHLLNVVNDILDFSKIEAGKLKLEEYEVSLAQVLDRSINLTSSQAFAKGLRFTVDEAIGLPTHFRGDAMRLIQILVNLLGNAVKFTQSGEIALRVEADPGEIRFLIRDSGIGMNEEQLGRLFHAFEQADGTTTRRFGGTGLGLAISRHLAQLMGGSISVQSRPGKGSQFAIRLPLYDARYRDSSLNTHIVLAGLGTEETDRLATQLCALGAQVSAATAEAAPFIQADLYLFAHESVSTVLPGLPERISRLGGKLLIAFPAGNPLPLPAGCIALDRPLRYRHIVAICREDAGAASEAETQSARLTGVRILAAEDNPINRMVLEEILHGEGAELTCVENGRQAVEVLERQGRSAFDLVLTDIQMPEMDGYEAARRILAQAPDLPIIGLTAHAMPEEKARCLAAGMVNHIPKPLDIDELVHCIQTQLAAQTTHPKTSGTRLHDTETGRDNSLPAIDLSLARTRFRKHPGLFERLLETLLQTNRDFPERLHRHAANRDFEDIAFLAHKLRGTASQLCAFRVEHLALQTETTAKSSDTAAFQHAHDLAEALFELLSLLEKELQPAQVAGGN